jgi:hypothetical protein
MISALPDGRCLLSPGPWTHTPTTMIVGSVKAAAGRPYLAMSDP